MATPAGRSALSVMRIAGPQTLNIMKQLAPSKKFVPQRARLTKLYGKHRNLLDEALVLFFEGPKSYTGEDVVELYLHGSPVVARAMQSAVLETQLARHAEPGEFTRRAFENSRMDLTQVEGIRDLLAAETEMQRQTAVGGASGLLGRRFESWRSQIVNSNAMLTAAIDFSEDNGLEDEFIKVRVSVERVRSQIDKALRQNIACSEIVKSGLKVALLGEPNAGKSSLTNYLLQRAACLVSDIPGTTRDVLEVALEVGGHKLVLLDTAGLRESHDTVEKLGIDRARDVIAAADIIVAIFPCNQKQSEHILAEIDKLERADRRVIRLLSKLDLSPHQSSDELAISIKTGEGMDAFVERLSSTANQIIKSRAFDSTLENPEGIGKLGMSARARGLLQAEALPGLTECIYFLERNDYVLANAELQRASAAIGLITGRGISVHEILDVVFGEFCIGK